MRNNRARGNIALAAKGWLDEVDDSYPERVNALNEFRVPALREALAHYQQTHVFDPKWIPARNMLRIAPRDAASLNEAISHYRQAIGIEPQSALAYGALGQAWLAKRDFAEAQAATQRSLDLLSNRQKSFRANLEAQLQRCKHLLALKGRLPAILQGRDKPVAGDCLELAELCYLKKHYATAVRLYAKALAAISGITDDLRAGHRFNAACAAALAGCGRGDKGARLGKSESTALRKQARDWLQLDLTAWATKLDAGTVADHIQAQRTLSPWRNEPDLAGLRDADTLDKLPRAEREESRKLMV